MVSFILDTLHLFNAHSFVKISSYILCQQSSNDCPAYSERGSRGMDFNGKLVFAEMIIGSMTLRFLFSPHFRLHTGFTGDWWADNRGLMVDWCEQRPVPGVKNHPQDNQSAACKHNGLFQKISTDPHARHWKSCKKCSVGMTGNPQISLKFCTF